MLGLSTALHLQTIIIIIEVFLGASQKTPHHSLQWYHVVSKRAKAAETSEWCQAGAPRHRRRRNCCGRSGEARRRSLPHPAHQAVSAVEHRVSRRPLWAQLTPCRTRVGLGTRVRIGHLQQGPRPFPICPGARGGGQGQAACLMNLFPISTPSSTPGTSHVCTCCALCLACLSLVSMYSSVQTQLSCPPF